jgi:hypothetical protein
MAGYERFLDLLDVQDDAVEERALQGNPSPTGLHLMGHDNPSGPLNWNTRCSIALQEVVNNFSKGDLYELEFSVTVADPSRPDCPLVACSIGFTELTGYRVQEIVGRNCRFLLNGVPSELVDDETRMRCRSFCMAGVEYDGQSEVLPAGASSCWLPLPKGELICVQTNATKSGELFRNMFYLKQVELDDAQFILGLQAGMPEDYDEPTAKQKLQKEIQAAWNHLDESMAGIEQVLSSQFWYQAPMRRQF